MFSEFPFLLIPWRKRNFTGDKEKSSLSLFLEILEDSPRIGSNPLLSSSIDLLVCTIPACTFVKVFLCPSCPWLCIGLFINRVSHGKNLVGYSFIIKGKMGRGKRLPSSSFLSRHHTFIISSSSRLGRGVFLSLHGQAGTVMVQWKNYFRFQYNKGLSVWNVTFP